ncbi:MAG: hypothetical protein ACI3ZP_06895 [Candidatus Cryptobacteroides sp.]
MRRFILIILSIALFSAHEMSGKGFRWGVEWGASGICHSNTSCIYTTEDGYLVEYKKISNRLHINAAVEGFIGMDFAGRLNISLRSGYSGLGDGERGVPLSLRPTLYFGKTPTVRGASLFVEGGLFFRRNADISSFVKLGTGWRTRLSSHIAMDFNIGIQLSGTHPDIYDKYSGKFLHNGEVRNLKCYNEGFFLSTALVF